MEETQGFLSFAVVVLTIVGLWKTFEKAGKPGWAAIVPIYNIIILFQIAEKPLWWALLLLIPGLNIIVHAIVDISFVKAYGKGTLFGLGVAFLPMIFIPILGFGEAEYIGLQDDQQQQ